MTRKPLNLLLQGIIFSLIGLWFVGVSFAKDFDDSQAGHIEYPTWFIDSPFYDLTDHLEQAGSDGKKGLMVLFTTQGCSYCSAFIKRSLGDPDLSAIVKRNFDSIGMEIFDDVDMVGPVGESLSVKAFAKREGAAFSPTLVFYDKAGQRVFRVVGYQSPKRFQHTLDYVIGEHYRSSSFRDYYQRIARGESSPSSQMSLKKDPLFIKPPYVLDRSRFAAKQPLVVIFEKPGCTECADFHEDVLALKEVRDILGQFEVARFDASNDKTPIIAPDGKRVTSGNWYRQTDFSRVPALMFFNEKGNKVLETDELVRRQRMLNSLNYVLERAYEKDWTYQRFARSKGIERSLKESKKNSH